MPPADPAFRLFPSPHPPHPLPSGKGEINVIFMQGATAPCIPGAEPKRHWLSLPYRYPCGGLVRLVACSTCHCGTKRECLPSLSPAYTAFSFFSAPIPPPPSQREGGDHKLVLPGATAPGTPALDRLRRLQSQQNRHSGGRRIPETALTGSAASGMAFFRKQA